MRGRFSLLQISLLLVPVWCEEYSITLDAQDKYNLTWSFDGTDAKDYVTFTITCETTGWVGVGTSPNGGMAGGDLAVAWVNASGFSFLQDMHSSANGLPSIDDKDHLTLLSASESNGVTTISFKRPINTCDEQDNEITSSTTRVIFAYGSSDPVNDVLSSGDYHSGNRGAKSVYLLDPRTPSSSAPADALTWDMVQNSYEVPSEDTTYYCSFHNPPALNSKHHIVAVEPLVTPGNEGIVHHIVVYACWGVADEHLVGNNKTEGVCFTDEMPEFFESCRTVFYAWAIGGTRYDFPAVAGYPLGGTEADGSPQYFLMETHYDNPQLISGKIDASGIRFTYTPTLRDEDAATIQIGNINGIFVPPQVDEFTIVAYCHSSCTREWVPEGGVEFFGYMLHAHLLGVAIKVEQFRGGQSIDLFAEDKAYDFNYQEGRSFPSSKKLLPGDTLKITCHYKSERASVTYGGEASSAEMCLAFLIYYPRQDISNCETMPLFFFDETDAIYAGLGVTPDVRNGGGYSYVDLENTMGAVQSWTSDIVNNAQSGIYNTGQMSVCRAAGGGDYESSFTTTFAQTDFVEKDYDEDFCSKEEPESSAANIHQTFASILIMLIVSSLI